MKKCPFCTAEIRNDEKKCSFCGKEQPVTKLPLGKRIKRIILFIVLGVVGLVLSCLAFGMYLESTPSGKATSTARAIAQAETEALFTKTPSKTPESSKTPKPTNTIVPSPSPTPDPSIQALIETVGLSEEKANAALEVITSAGFKRIYELNFETETSKFKAYSADLGYTTLFRIAFAEGKIVIIDDAHNTYFDAATGVIDPITNYTLGAIERSTFMYLAQEAVKQVLKAPSTAQFPDPIFSDGQWHVGRNHDLVTIQSWVDAQNSFGAMIRSDFIVQFDYSTQNILYINLDGRVMYGKLQKP